MQERIRFLAAAALGSLCLYCAPAAMDALSSTGDPVRDANAQVDEACCRPPADQFVKLGAWSLPTPISTDDPLLVTEAIDVTGFRELVVYLDRRGSTWEEMICQPYHSIAFRPDGETPFGTTGQGSSATGRRIRVDGQAIRLSLGVVQDPNYASSDPERGCPDELHFVLAGIR